MAKEPIPNLEALSMEELIEGFTQKFHAFGKILQCPICLSLLSDTAMTKCAHAFCRKCFTRSLKDRDPSCPLCKKAVSRREARGHANVDALVKIYKSVFCDDKKDASSKPGDEYSQVASMSQIQQSLAARADVHASPMNVDPSQGFQLQFQFDLDEIDTPVQAAASKQRKSGVTLTTPISMLSATSKALPGSTSTLATVIVSRTPATHLNPNGRTPATELVSRTPATVLVRKPEEVAATAVDLQAKPPRASSNILTPKVHELGLAGLNVHPQATEGKVDPSSSNNAGVGAGVGVGEREPVRSGIEVKNAPSGNGVESGSSVADVEKRSSLVANMSIRTADLPETQVSQLGLAAGKGKEGKSTRGGGELVEPDASESVQECTKQQSPGEGIEATLPMDETTEEMEECQQQQTCGDGDGDGVEATLLMDPDPNLEDDAKKSEEEQDGACEVEEVIECTVNETVSDDEDTMTDVNKCNGTQDEEVPSSLPDEEELPHNEPEPNKTFPDMQRSKAHTVSSTRAAANPVVETRETKPMPTTAKASSATRNKLPANVISESPVETITSSTSSASEQPKSKDEEDIVEPTLQDQQLEQLDPEPSKTIQRSSTVQNISAAEEKEEAEEEEAIEPTLQESEERHELDQAVAPEATTATANVQSKPTNPRRPKRKATPLKPPKKQSKTGATTGDKPNDVDGTKGSAAKETSVVFKFKDKVTVARRMGPGQNKPGGMALIYSVNQDGTYDVKYVLGGTERHVAVEYLRHGHHVDDESVCGRATSKRKRRLAASAQSSSSMPKAKVAKRIAAKTTKAKSRPKKENRGRNVAAKGKKGSAELPVIVFTGVKDAKTKYHAAIKRMKGQPASGNAADFKKVTHVVTGPKTKQGIVVNRTMKYFLALASGCWIVDQNWLTQSLDKGVWQDEASFEVRGDSKTKSKGSGGPKRAREARLQREPLLAGYKVYLAGSFNATPSHPCLPKGEIENLLFMCGASLLKPSQLGALKKDKAATVVVLSKDTRSIKHDTHAKQVSRLVSSGILASVNNAWLLDGLCLYEIQDVTDQQYTVKT